MTSTPALRAFFTAGTIAFVSLGVIRIALAPPEIMFSIAVTWVALSPSNLPAPVISVAPCFFAAFWAPSSIFTRRARPIRVRRSEKPERRTQDASLSVCSCRSCRSPGRLRAEHEDRVRRRPACHPGGRGREGRALPSAGGAAAETGRSGQEAGRPGEDEGRLRQAGAGAVRGRQAPEAGAAAEGFPRGADRRRADAGRALRQGAGGHAEHLQAAAAGRGRGERPREFHLRARQSGAAPRAPVR